MFEEIFISYWELYDSRMARRDTTVSYLKDGIRTSILTAEGLLAEMMSPTYFPPGYTQIEVHTAYIRRMRTLTFDASNGIQDAKFYRPLKRENFHVFLSYIQRKTI